MATEALTTDETPEHRPHAEGGAHGGHPSDATYIKVAVFLSLVTALEITLSYLKIGLLTNPVLLVLAVVKFTAVAMFFMHLRFDNRMLRRLFISGIILAGFVYFAVMLMFGVFIKR
jgi:cytochrome c oxidase subunit 4